MTVMVPPTAPSGTPGIATNTWLLAALCTRNRPFTVALLAPAIVMVSRALKPGALAKLNVTTPPLAVAEETDWVLNPLTKQAFSSAFAAPFNEDTVGAPVIAE